MLDIKKMTSHHVEHAAASQLILSDLNSKTFLMYVLIEIKTCHLGLWGLLGLAERKGRGTKNGIAQFLLLEAGSWIFFWTRIGFILLNNRQEQPTE